MKTIELTPTQVLAVELGFPVFIYEDTYRKLFTETYYALRSKNGTWFTGKIVSCRTVSSNLYQIEWLFPTTVEVLCMQLLIAKPFPVPIDPTMDRNKITETIRVIGSTPLDGWVVGTMNKNNVPVFNGLGAYVHKTKELAEQEMRRLIEIVPNKTFVVAKLESSAKMEVNEPLPP